MTLKPQEYYYSNLIDPFTDDEMTQEDLQSEGYDLYKLESILETIGTSESQVNIELFFDEVIDELSKEGREDYARDCFKKLIEQYNLVYLDSVIEIKRADTTYTDKIFDLLKFLESSRVIDVVADCIPYVSLPTIRSKDDLKEFLKLNYKDFVQGLEKNRSKIPDFFYEEFLFCSKKDGIETLVKLIQKDAIGIQARQIVKGE